MQKINDSVEFFPRHFIPPPLIYNWKEDSKRSIKEHFETYFKPQDERPIVIYAHGNDGDRSAGHRTGKIKTIGEQTI